MKVQRFRQVIASLLTAILLSLPFGCGLRTSAGVFPKKEASINIPEKTAPEPTDFDAKVPGHNSKVEVSRDRRKVCIAAMLALKAHRYSELELTLNKAREDRIRLTGG